jgi:hypothetical protein
VPLCILQIGLESNIVPTLKAGSENRDLFQWYAMLRVEDVTTSNEWYRTFPVEEWYGENMRLTYEYLKTHMATDFLTKIVEEYNMYPAKATT